MQFEASAALYKKKVAVIFMHENTLGEFSLAFWYCASWKNGGFKKCGMKMGFFKNLSIW